MPAGNAGIVADTTSTLCAPCERSRKVQEYAAESTFVEPVPTPRAPVGAVPSVV